MNAKMKYRNDKAVCDYIDSIWNELTQHAKDVICGTEGWLIPELFGGMTAEQINEYTAREWPEDED